MKNFTFLFVFLLSLTLSQAKDVSIKVINDNVVPLTVWMGSISSKDNVYTDDEIVQLSDQLSVKPNKRQLAAGKKLQSNQKGLSKGDVFIAYGMFEGGGRTVVKRFFIKELEARLTITFDKIELYMPNKSYINIVKELKKTDDLGEGVAVKNTQMIGMFLFYNVQAETYTDVFLLDPANKIALNDPISSSNEVGDFLLKDATAPFMSEKGKLRRKIPEETEEIFNQVTFPGYSSRTQLFGDKQFRFLTWSVTNSQVLEAKIGKQEFLPLFNSCSEIDKKYVYRKFMDQVNKEVDARYHLIYITAMRKSDKIEIISSGYNTLNEKDELFDNDIKTLSNAYRLNDNKEVVFMQENMISYVNGQDITPLLYYVVGKTGNFSATEFYADNLVNLYEELGNYIELPQLDMDVISLYDPAYSISKVKEYLNDPKILKTVESRLKADLPIPIPVEAIQAADKKLDKK
ncbi:MAG: hypothetical protein ISR55_03520 [Bacteroidetes bacterium]|nr:hypothetical protein [Bacteroidota bacterium]